MLERHVAVEQKLASAPLIGGNRTSLLRDGAATFRAIFAAIRQARKHVNLEYYIFEDVTSDGQSISDLLIEKRRQGVVINLIYDSYGSGDTPSAVFDRLGKAGINLVSYNPVDPLDAKTDYSLNRRDHRKILIADGRHAIIGGVNLASIYERRKLGRSAVPESLNNAPVRDNDLTIDGPAVAALQRIFMDHWTEQKGPPLPDADYFPSIPDSGKEIVRVVAGTPESHIPAYYLAALSAIATAQRSIRLSAAYFVPSQQELELLKARARAGVDVELLLPGFSDSDLSLEAGRSYYDDLLAAGVKIHEATKLFLHTKTLTVDGVWSAIGSSNFDHRSVLFNDEVDAIVLGTETAKALEAMFDQDLKEGRPIERGQWADRPFTERFREYASRLVEPLL